MRLRREFHGLRRASLELTCELQSTPDAVWAWVGKPALFLHNAAPLIRFDLEGGDRLPEVWETGEYRGKLRLFGVLPIGWQAIRIHFLPPEGESRVARDSGYSPIFRAWEHRIEVAPLHGGTRYTDAISFDAGWLTPIVAPVIRLFFWHRHRRLRALDRSGFAALKD